MSQLAAEYRRQFAWRPWPEIFATLPALAGKTVLDLGCGPGDQAAELVRRGARVIGIDAQAELIAAAEAQALANAEFRVGDLRALPDDLLADGIWSSFSAAYFPDLSTTLTQWAGHLRPGGFMALTEVDDLFGHEPLSETTRELLAAYAQDSLAAGRYDFHMGRKLAGQLANAGLRVRKSLVLLDQELAGDGPATPAVVDAWRQRFDRMAGLRTFCGAEFERVRAEFLACLSDRQHRALARIHCALAVKAV